MFKGWKSRIHSRYSHSSNPSATTGFWSLYQGRSRSNQSQKVTVHIFDKKKFEQHLSHNGLNKKHTLNEVYDFVRTAIGNLTKMKHPLFLNILEPFEESSSKITIVSEAVTCTLSDISDLNLSPLETLKGILQISKALQFLNADAQFLHLNLTPSSVFLTPTHDWKLSGLGFLTKIDFDNELSYDFKSWDPRMPGFVSQDYDFMAPEVAIDGKICSNTDAWSLAALIYFVYNGQPIISCSGSGNYYKEELNKMESKLNNPALFLKKVPEPFHQTLVQMLQRQPMVRVSGISDVLKSPAFQDGELRVLTYLDDEFPIVSPEQKLQFLKNQLIPLLPSLPKEIKVNKLLHQFVDMMSDKQELAILPTVYEIIFSIGSQLSHLSFYDLVLSKTYANTTLILSSPELTLTILTNLETIKSMVTTNEDEFVKFLKKIVTKTLDPPPQSTTANPTLGQSSTQVTLATLNLTLLLIETLDFPFIKNTIFPKLTHLFTTTTSLALKLGTVAALRDLTLHSTKGLDKFMIKESVIPLLKAMRARDTSIVLSVLSLIDAMVTSGKLSVGTGQANTATSSSGGNSTDVIVKEIIPLLWDLSMAETLDAAQYSEFVRVISTIGGSVMKARLTTLGGDVSIVTSPPTKSALPSPVRPTVQSPLPMKISNNDVNTVLQPVSEPAPQFVKPKVTPLALTPTPRAIIAGSSNSGFRNNNKLLNNSIKDVSYDDEFDTWVGFDTAEPTPQGASIKTNIVTSKYGSNFNSNVLQPTQRASAPNAISNILNTSTLSNTSNSSIDWTSEAYKTQNVKLPPGFGDSLIPAKQKPIKISNSSNGGGWSQGDSLI